MDSNGNLFFGLMDPIAIACWDSSKPYTSSHMRVVAQNDETLQFSSGMKVVLNKKGKEELWVLTCSFQVRNGIFSFFYSQITEFNLIQKRVMTGSISSREVNFRIQGIQIEDLLNGSQCTRSGVEMGSSFAFPYY